MQKLSFVPVVRADQATALSPAISPVVRPKLQDRAADIDLPRKLFENWIPKNGKRAISREMTAPERKALQGRFTELTVGLTPFEREQRDQVRAPLHAMLGGFRSLRESGEDAETAVEVLLAVLRDFPIWAIEEACIRIARCDIAIDPPLDKRWAPSDAQIYAAVAAIVKPYRKALDAVTDLLEAPVAQAVQLRPTRAELEAKLGRPIGAPAGDGKHAERVAEDLQRRKQLATDPPKESSAA